jgi:hypothetical protein
LYDELDSFQDNIGGADPAGLGSAIAHLIEVKVEIALRERKL